MALRRGNRAWYRTAKATAIVTGLFTLVVAGLLLYNHTQVRYADPSESAELQALRAGLRADPRNEEIKEEFRWFDQQLRYEYFKTQTIQERGMILLLGGLIALVVSARYAAHCRREMPMPNPDRPDADAERRQARVARWSVGTLGVAMLAGAVVWGLAGGTGCYVEVVEIAGQGEGDGNGENGPEPVPEAGPPTPEEIAAQWPRFRGPTGMGIATTTDVPTEFDGAKGEGIAWKVELDLPGHSSPVVWGDRIFLTGGNAGTRAVYCYSTADGTLLWKTPVSTPQGDVAAVDIFEDTGWAAATPATDGRYLCAIFANSDVACLDTEGKVVWTRHLGVPQNMYGIAASLAIDGDRLIVPFDQGLRDEGLSRLLALDLKTGETIWEAQREVAASWSTPVITETTAGRTILTTAAPFAMAHDPETGAEIWRAKILEGDVAASPVYADGLVYATTVDSDLFAIRPAGSGDVTDTHVAWRGEGYMPDTTSPLTDGKHLWVVTTDGLLSCYDAKTGEQQYEHETEMVFKGSPTLVGDRIMLLSNKGVLLVAGTRPEFEERGRSELGERSSCSPAFLPGRIYVRGHTHLYAIGQ